MNDCDYCRDSDGDLYSCPNCHGEGFNIMTPKTNAQLQKTRDDKQRAMGRTGRKVWATPEEHAHINQCLAKYRKKQERLARKAQ